MATIIKTRNLVKMILVLAMFLVLLSPSRPAMAIQSPVEITVDTTTDSNATAFRACTAAANDCSLRGAISKANNTPANRYTIHVPAGVYTLALTGAQEDQNATGDLDILTGLNLSGVGAEHDHPGRGNDHEQR